LTSVDGIAYTWDKRGNLTHDGTFTYTYNAAGRMVRAQSVTATLVYTYNHSGLRVAQSVDGDPKSFSWDWATGIPEMLSAGDALYLVGRETLGQYADGAWVYHLPDALGSVRQWTDEAGSVTYAAGYTPYGEGLWQAGSTQSAWGYTGEWWDADLGMEYLRARWYSPQVGRFTRRDPWEGDLWLPKTLPQSYVYVVNNPVNVLDPSGLQCIGCHTPGDWAEYILFYAYGIRLKRTPFIFTESERLLILDTVEDYSELLGGASAFRRNLALSKIRMDWATRSGAFNAFYNTQKRMITLPPNWYSPRIAIAPNGTALIMLANPCLEEMLGFPEGSLLTDETEAKFVLAHEMGHAFHTGNPEALRSFKEKVDLPWSTLAGFSSNPIIARNAGRPLTSEVFADAIAAFLYSPDLLNQQMLDWVQDDMPGILQ